VLLISARVARRLALLQAPVQTPRRRFAVALPLLALACLVGAGMPLSAASPRGAGFTRSVQTRVAAYHVDDAPTALVHAPDGFDPKPPLNLVVFLHGFNGCVEVVAASGSARCRPGEPERDGYGVVRHHDRAGTNTLLVIPQLAFMRRDGKPGCFGRPGCFRRFLQELLGETLASELGGARSLHDLGSVTLVAHSAGYKSALAILQRGEITPSVRGVVLLDALYGEAEDYARWLAGTGPDVRFISFYLDNGKTYAGSRTLLKLARRTLGAAQVAQLDAAEFPEHVAPRRLIIAEGHVPHRQMPEGYLTTALRALDLPQRAPAGH
jgi:pimeloyl-ACP methyl ester carboxylesterase